MLREAIRRVNLQRRLTAWGPTNARNAGWHGLNSPRVEAKLVGNLLKLASGSDGTALKAITFALQCRFGWSLYAPPPPERPLGKKEQLQMEAETAHAGNSWGELLQ